MVPELFIWLVVGGRNYPPRFVAVFLGSSLYCSNTEHPYRTHDVPEPNSELRRGRNKKEAERLLSVSEGSGGGLSTRSGGDDCSRRARKIEEMKGTTREKKGQPH
ncbi:unnamed protein product [Tenebrio molitor]|nr:unnamed protein product [Tenebrio molitor]